ncbi:carboxypeptidase regulatory-like domain-containing protein [Algoriphagus limi]|uniref:Carboxypeptidase regulatory-like domain-containing protein n=1 Tax=Algoriphagus limi TaxID=2975273 RepID=A0ABT2G827_9BACT|nr:carboxypeptidase regulatory-like domain-containing protein [Algoriphagus limi]MCS5490165.1 carboxypeptidase regulatory-like domain-containing protein [Algoriphagus limi]
MQKIPYLLYILAIVLMNFSCKSQTSESQGISGKVTWLEGNQMPMISEDGDASPVNPKGIPAKRTILIYPLTNLADSRMEDGLFVQVKGEPIAKTESDENGEYKLELSPGRYSIFTQEEDGLFANLFDGEGNIQPVTIRDKEWTILDIIINYKAVF